MVNQKPLSPRIHGQYRDDTGRTLRVTAIQPADPRGRDIVGKVTLPDGTVRDYSTTMLIFPEVWTKEVL